MKKYVLTVSHSFPKTHKRAGEPTNFPIAIKKSEKLHTIRGNYELWEKRFKQIEAGEACLSVRLWEGKPYNSKQFEICRLDKSHGIGVQKIEIGESLHFASTIDGKKFGKTWEISKNDGLSLDDFEEWFKDYDLTKPMAIIHFTNFRY
jgi:hypothetical protein